jgi:uncharacterized protein YecE (DUF72 family)
LKDPEEPVERFFANARSLGRTLGPVLYQLPPRWPVNLERLTDFLNVLPPRRRHVIEFRDPSWYVDAVFEALERHGVALCLHDMAGAATERVVTGRFVYVRFHGPVRYGGRYSDDALSDWSDWLNAQRAEGRPLYAYFNNDVGGHAPKDAIRLRALIGM